MSTHRIHIFISHSWRYSGHYSTLNDWVFGGTWRFGQASLVFLDYSVPKDDLPLRVDHPVRLAHNDRADRRGSGLYRIVHPRLCTSPVIQKVRETAGPHDSAKGKTCAKK